jgi:hypothetical protein
MAERKNEVLYRAIKEVWPSINKFCREHNFSAVQVGRLINFRLSPLGAQAEFKEVCQRLSAVLGIGLEDLFPPLLYGQEKPVEFKHCSYEELSAVGLIPQGRLPQEGHPESFVPVNLALLKAVENLNRAELQELMSRIIENRHSSQE